MRLGYWVKLFKTQTWVIKSSEVIKTGFKLNEDERLRYLQEAREDGERILRTYQYEYKRRQEKLAEKNLVVAKEKLTFAKEELAIAEKNLCMV